jgi:Major tropism determinant N-terminal domain
MSPTVPSTPFRRLKLRRDSSNRWAQVNPVLAEGEPAFELDTGKIKIGDGVSTWSDLGYLRSTEMIEHILAEEPHPVYDDGPSLTLLYENAKV